MGFFGGQPRARQLVQDRDRQFLGEYKDWKKLVQRERDIAEKRAEAKRAKGGK